MSADCGSEGRGFEPRRSPFRLQENASLSFSTGPHLLFTAILDELCRRAHNARLTKSCAHDVDRLYGRGLPSSGRAIYSSILDKMLMTFYPDIKMS
jgi:hypothetical protein